jgi:hypothetical protein
VAKKIKTLPANLEYLAWEECSGCRRFDFHLASACDKWLYSIHDCGLVVIFRGIVGSVGTATTFIGGDVGLIPTLCTIEVWQWTFRSRTVWLVKKSNGQDQLYFAALDIDKEDIDRTKPLFSGLHIM